MSESDSDDSDGMITNNLRFLRGMTIHVRVVVKRPVKNHVVNDSENINRYRQVKCLRQLRRTRCAHDFIYIIIVKH